MHTNPQLQLTILGKWDHELGRPPIPKNLFPKDFGTEQLSHQKRLDTRFAVLVDRSFELPIRSIPVSLECRELCQENPLGRVRRSGFNDFQLGCDRFG
jgi:hypothetical protein